MDTLDIVYPGTYKRYNITNLIVIRHEIPDQEGVMQNTKCVEFLVLGKNHNWKLWALYDEFVEANPHIEI